MKFRLNNIGAIRKADIDIEGITIIAGENNVGKSTVGKALYAFLHDMNLWEKTYNETCSVRIEKLLSQSSIRLDDWCMKVSGAKRRRTNRTNQLIKRYAKSDNFRGIIEDFQLADDEKSKNEAINSLNDDLKQYSHEYLTLYAKEKADDIWNHENKWFLEWIQNTIPMIREIELDEVTIQTSQIQESLNTVFKGQYRRIGTNTSEMEFIDDTNRGVKFSLKDNNILLDIPLRVTSRIFFIESPKLYDYLSNNAYGTVQKEYLRHLMSPNIFKNNKNISSDRLKEESEIQESSQRVSEITKRIEKVMGGRAEFLQKIGLEFKDNRLPESIHDINVSTGLKSLALLEYALRIGAIEKGDILILDEPEINLHPEWQVEYAKALVDLQKEFGLKIVITSHSPYFMRAIECFTDLSDTMNLLNVYRVTKGNTGESKIENVSYSEYGITELYEDLSAPLEKLDELLEKKYGED